MPLPPPEEFLHVLGRDEARRRFEGALRLEPLAIERVSLAEALGRVLGEDVTAEVDVPSFDRANVDGFAVKAADTHGATEQQPRRLRLLEAEIAPGQIPPCEIGAGTAVPIATGGMLPRGADAVVMVEHAYVRDGQLYIQRPVTAGAAVTFAGTDIAAGELVLYRGTLLTSRETGVLAAIGRAAINVWRRPRVAIISTGNELIPPGASMRPGLIYDSNARTLSDAIRECGGEPLPTQIVPDDIDALRQALRAALDEADLVLLSGGTSKGGGDLSYRAVEELRAPGVLVHGVALKPGKPLCLAVTHGKGVVVLPGFPTSAIFTYHEFVAPVIRKLAGLSGDERKTVSARLPVRVNSEPGRTEYVLVRLVEGQNMLAAYPMGQGSGSVTAFSRADGFVVVEQYQELLEAESIVQVHLLAAGLRAADLVVIGSHCVGLDLLLGELHHHGWRTKFLAVGSTAGLQAAIRGECDLAGIHLLDPVSGRYNEPFLREGLELIPGYRRMQGVVFRAGDPRFEGCTAAQAVQRALEDPTCVMVNRNQGSGTRILIDGLLRGAQPPGYAVQPRNHNAVAAAVLQGRADWGVAVEWVARRSGLGFLPLAEECYDFVVPRGRTNRPAVAAFRTLLAEAQLRQSLRSLGLQPSP
jgi:putative molybdopterin biosynthesis protein